MNSLHRDKIGVLCQSSEYVDTEMVANEMHIPVIGLTQKSSILKKLSTVALAVDGEDQQIIEYVTQLRDKNDALMMLAKNLVPPRETTELNVEGKFDRLLKFKIEYKDNRDDNLAVIQAGLPQDARINYYYIYGGAYRT